jgi:murein DD-endopeptidase MepM/ murein hydrolase activator NlpD
MTLRQVLLKYKNSFARVVPFNATTEVVRLFDFTENNTELSDDLVEDTDRFSEYIKNKLLQADARYGIGGYNEHRTIYKRSLLFGSDASGEAGIIRRLHLGTDIWGDAGTPVMAPLDGTVHSFAFNNHFGDYGTTIILAHALDDIRFYSLYGHLSLASIENLERGASIKKGQSFASFGNKAENGHWPPHLHFQLIENIQGWDGDYPGVCAFDERENWLNNSPDPDLVLQMNRYRI